VAEEERRKANGLDGTNGLLLTIDDRNTFYNFCNDLLIKEVPVMACLAVLHI
jgi:hypothetical protein